MQTRITDPAVTLTDYGLAIECAVVVVLLLRRQVTDDTLRLWLVVFFAAASAASLLGGTVHGFLRADSPRRAILWPATLISILVSGLAVSFVAARIQLGPEAQQVVRVLAIGLLAIMVLAVIFAKQSFAIAIAGYLPATLFLLYAFAATYERTRAGMVWWGIAGVSLSIVGAAVQRLGVKIHRVYLDHNALYHVLQGAGFWMIYKAVQFISTTLPSIGRTNAIAS
jgi:hypothetical protein